MREGKNQSKIGFIGQGFIGKNYADDFERRGYSVIRYALEEPYRGNRANIQECDIVFIAVPTPTTPQGFDAKIVEEALTLLREDTIAVIKSTVLPGTTLRFQESHSNLIVLYSPEFLSEATAAHDAANPFSNIVGLSKDTKEQQDAARRVLNILPKAPFERICSSTEAELVKYTHNISGYTQVITFNILYDLAQNLGVKWEENVAPALKADPMISNRYANPVHKSGRGAGGACFIKDLAALRELYEQSCTGDKRGMALLRALEEKNIELLKNSKKDLDLLEGVYGNDV